ncbi:hypothetical protein [Comamonas aquatica]|uniref:hypothetical protein n=1 Tax=Comamonas aquatica TaxID=225991 RepID=UPI00244D7408|nr:hypothetical protein [Comamonas aquatica]MDH1674465.1 hypothetical protein [Comamonas aquatica]MDH1677294.1 hypothetical protein [Comamonas aquatica]
MGVPSEQLIIVDSLGQQVDLDTLIEELRAQGQRVLVDDAVGVVVYVGGLGLYNLKPTGSGDFLAQPLTEIHRPRFSMRVLRKQIGATVLSITADAIFVVRDGDTLKKVRAEKLIPGMVLSSGEKVYR